jgi:hypothetical protein
MESLRLSCRSPSTATTARACTSTSRSGRAASPLFAGNKYADLSQECLWYIGGIIKHAKALNAFTNPSTNSYKRLVPGYEAPVLLAYSARNRSAVLPIPWTTSPKAKRVEVASRPDRQPYLAFAALLMAGLDGIQNKIDPGQAMDKDLYDLPPRELKKIPTVCGSLREALASLDKDRAFLKAGGVFNDDFIDSFIELKMTEVARFEMTPHPVEFQMYYSSERTALSSRLRTRSPFAGAARLRLFRSRPRPKTKPEKISLAGGTMSGSRALNGITGSFCPHGPVPFRLPTREPFSLSIRSLGPRSPSGLFRRIRTPLGRHVSHAARLLMPPKFQSSTGLPCPKRPKSAAAPALPSREELVGFISNAPGKVGKARDRGRLQHQGRRPASGSSRC